MISITRPDRADVHELQHRQQDCAHVMVEMLRPSGRAVVVEHDATLEALCVHAPGEGSDLALDRVRAACEQSRRRLPPPLAHKRCDPRQRP